MITTERETKKAEATPAPRVSRRRRVLFVAGTLAAAPVLLFALGELYVRMRYPAYADLWGAIRSNPTWVRELRPSASGRLRSLTRRDDGAFEYDTTFHTNAQGLREPATIGAKRAGTPRVLVLGDSLTFGMGVEDDEVWTRKLAPRFEPVNAGWASGYAPDMACLFLEERGIGFEPDVVIEALTPHNDLDDMGNKSVWTQDASGKLLSIRHNYGWVPDAIQALAFPRFLALQVFPSIRNAPGTAQQPGTSALTPAEQKGVERLEYALRRERDFLASKKIPLVVLLYSDEWMEPGASADERGWVVARREAMRVVAKELALPILDPDASAEMNAAPRPHFFKHDGHMTRSGNEGLGNYVARALASWNGGGQK